MQTENPRAPQDYAEWLALSPEQQEWIKCYVWDPYNGVGRCFAMMAAARLMMEDRRIQDIFVGIYHGGEYILNPTVSNLDFKACPPWLEQVFEGFRVGWLKKSYEFDPKHYRKFEGTWTCEDGRCDAIFRIQVADEGVSVSGHHGITGETLQVKLWEWEFDGHWLSFEAKLAPDGPNTLHRFMPCEPDQGRLPNAPQDLNRCENVMRVPTFWNKKLDSN